MFSGIVEEVGTIVKRVDVDGGATLSIQATLFSPQTVSLGDSICINGVCLTVVSIEQNQAVFDVCSETLRCTSFSDLQEGSKVNLERSLKVGDRIHGHFVSGHVDSSVKLLSLEQEGETYKFTFASDGCIKPYLARKGSVTINGTSLTLGEVYPESFSVYIIPHTFSHTTFSDLSVGDLVNVEVDMLARYVREQLGSFQN